MPLPKFRRENRKVKFSYPFAYLDSQFLMKTQQHEARRTTRHSGQVVTSAGLPNSPVRKRRSEVTSHSSSGESSATQLPPLKTVAGAKPKPSKKARLDRAAEEDVAPEHDQAPDHEVFTCEDIPNDHPLQDDVIPEKGPIHIPASADPPASSVQIEKSHTPADKPAAPTQTGESKDDDVVITGVGRSEPGNPATLTRHTIKEDSSPLNKGKWDVELETYLKMPSVCRLK
ncbi:uncharacterized protein [Triticum aestivum]|uniref:uncharacterized protein n=1 Tax=Triticum aestivum TaxID=4565 RepID=UPI001D00FD23|nr:uncharacterized protein LOC123157809 [Triticum aestivum]